MKVLPYGERGVYVDLEAGDGSDRASRTHALASRLRASFPAADVVAGAGVVAVFGGGNADVREVAERGSTEAHTAAPVVRTHEIPVRYDGPDLEDVAASLGISREAVIDLHAGREHTVEVVGFLPGFAYMGPLDARLVLPRRPAPRPRVPARTVAIAGAFTGIYPLASPGGWNLLGMSLGPLPFDPARAEPFLFAPGDRVRFVPIDDAGEAPREGEVAVANAWEPNESTGRSGVVVGRNPGPATVQDAGRVGLLSKGMPPSGPLDPELHAATNIAAGNAPGAAAIELLSGSLELTARGDVVLSIDGEPATALRDGESRRVTDGELSHARGAARPVRYIALAGGLDVPIVVGARATLLSAKLGGASGRALRRGDFLCAGRPSASGEAPPVALDPGGVASASNEITFGRSNAASAAPIEIDPGPHLDRFPASALDVLLATEWRLSRLVDRTGARLEGARIPRTGPDLAAPVPMRRGAVQVTTDGTPIVLGPDHPTTGGYPVLAVVRAASFGALAQRRPGDPVRFRLASR